MRRKTASAISSRRGASSTSGDASGVTRRDEHGLFDRGELSADEQKRLADVQVQLDRCWDLLRQQRAAEVVKKYTG